MTVSLQWVQVHGGNAADASESAEDDALHPEATEATQQAAWWHCEEPRGA